MLTVNPLERVVLSVFIPWEEGVANLLLGWMARSAALLRRAWFRLRGRRREAIAAVKSGKEV